MLHLHTHSVFSYKRSIAKVEDIVRREKELGENTFCITDYDSLTSFIKAFDYAKKNDMKFIPGCEFLFRPDPSIDKNLINEEIAELNKSLRRKKTTDEEAQTAENRIKELKTINSIECHSIVLLAKNENGLKSIINIFNNAKEVNEVFYVTKEDILNNTNGVIALSGGIKSDIIYYIRNHNDKKAIELLKEYKNVFKENYNGYEIYNFYAEIEYQEMNRNPEGILTEVESFNKLINMSKGKDEYSISNNIPSLNIPLVITNDIKYVEEKDRENYRLFVNILNNSKESIKFYKDHCHMCTEEELRNRMSGIYPKEAIEEGFKNIKYIESKCEYIKEQKANPLKDRSDELVDLCMKGWEKLRKGTEYEQASLDRLKTEFETVNGKNFSEYFIKVLNIVDLAHALEILIGPGRGSGCGSEICYLTGITHIDPLKYNLFFERFLNPERHGFPDIDLDMSTIPLNHVLKEESHKVVRLPKILEKLQIVRKLGNEINANELNDIVVLESKNDLENSLDDQEYSYFDQFDLIKTKSHGTITALEIYDLVQMGEEVEV